LSELQTVKQENTKNPSIITNTTTWSALEDTKMPSQENSTILKKEAKASLIVPEMSRTEESEELDPVETPIAYLNRGRSSSSSSRSRSHSGSRGGSDVDDDDDSGLSRTATIALVSSIGGVFLLALIIGSLQCCNGPYVRYRWRMWKAAQRNHATKGAAAQRGFELKETNEQDDTSHQMETSV